MAKTEAENSLAFARRDRERAQRLVDAGAAPARRLEEARLNESTIEIRLKAAEARLAQYESSRGAETDGGSRLFAVRAPMTGTIVESHAISGANVRAGDVLFRIIDTESVYVSANVPEAELVRLRQVTGAELQIPNGPAAKPLGRQISVGRMIDPQSRTVPVLYEMNNSDRQLVVGQAVQIRLFTSANTKAPAYTRVRDRRRRRPPGGLRATCGGSLRTPTRHLGKPAGRVRPGRDRCTARRASRNQGRVSDSALIDVEPDPGARACALEATEMIDSLIRWSLHNRAIVLGFAAVFLIWGGYSISQMPVDVLPDLSAPTVTILVEGPGMVPTEMEPLVTLPIESALNGAAGVRRVRSATAVGVAVIWVEFNWGQDIQRARQIVTEKLGTVTGALPPGVETPFLAPVSSIMGEILFISLESDQHSPLELRTTAETVVRRRLLAVPGVSQVIATGGGQKQYQVLVDSHRLRSYNVSMNEVETALKNANSNSSAGFMVAGGQEYLIQGVGRVRTEDDIGRVVITNFGTRPVLVRDVADVRVGAALKRGEGSHNGEPAVILGIQKQPGANTLELTRTLDGTLDDIQKTLPQGMTIDRHIFRQADFIERALTTWKRRFATAASWW